MTTLFDIVEKEAQTEKIRAGFAGKVRVTEAELLIDPHEKDKLENSFFGVIDTRVDEIDVGYKPSYEKKRPGKTKIVVEGVLRHEFNHKADARIPNRGCPKTVKKHLELYEIIGQVLKAKGFGSYDIQYMVNAFEDFIDNVNVFTAFDEEGQVRFWEDVGENGGYTDFYEAFVKLHSIFFNKKHQQYVRRFYKGKDNVKEVLDSFLQKTGLNGFTKTTGGKQVFDRKAALEYAKRNKPADVSTKDFLKERLGQFTQTEGGKKVWDTRSMVGHLNDDSKWGSYAQIFAEEFSKLMTPGYARPIPGLSGKRTKGRQEKAEKADGIPWDEMEGGNVFDQEMKDPDARKDEAFENYRSGKARPEWLNRFEALDAVYHKLAKKLNVKAMALTQSTQMPVTYFSKRKFNPAKDRPRRLRPGVDRETAKRQVEIKRYPVNIPLEYKVSGKGFPEVRFVMLDTSGSMESTIDGEPKQRENYIPWGSNSKYHCALLAWYGFVEYLRLQHLLKKTTVSLANFSNSTKVGKNLDDAKKIALSPQFGGTELDTGKIRHMFQGKPKLMFTISDGGIDNWGSIRDEFIKAIKDNSHYYFHLQIGSGGIMTKDLEQAGIPVYHINNVEDLWRKVITVTDDVYRGKISQLVRR
jgi:hypothetical protein